jgi:glycosyltransferase involved in cell wall biosynthesis
MNQSNTQDIRISVVIPSFNQAEYIEEAILSILNQGYANVEIILIDGQSTDQTLDIIKKYQKHFKYWCSEPDNGQADALVKGFAQATGEVLYWLCSDDIALPGVFARVAKIFASNPSLDLVYGDTAYLYPDNSITLKKRIAYHYPTMLWAFNIIAQPSCFFTRRAYIASGGINPDFNYAMDYDLFLRFGPQLHSLQVKEVLSFYRIHSSSKTASQLPKFISEWNEARRQIMRGKDLYKHNLLWLVYTFRVMYAFFVERGEVKVFPDIKKYIASAGRFRS